MQGDYTTIGDRTLTLWVGAGFLYYSTYNMPVARGSAPDVPKSIDYRTSLNDQWIWTYFGYSKDKQKAFAYARFGAFHNFLEWTDLNHFVPSEFSFYLGGDKIYNNFRGTLGCFSVEIGPDAY